MKKCTVKKIDSYKREETEKEKKWKKQRAEKGFCDLDIYEIDTWFFRILPKMLEEFYKHTDTIPQIIINEYFDEHKNELLKYGYKNSSYFYANDEFSNDKLDKKIEKECVKKWKETIKKMIFYFKDSNDDTCSLKNKHNMEFTKASNEYAKKYGEFGEKTYTKEELEEFNRKGSIPAKFMFSFPEYEPIYNKWRKEEDKKESYCLECKKKALDMFCKYLNYLWW